MAGEQNKCWCFVPTPKAIKANIEINEAENTAYAAEEARRSIASAKAVEGKLALDLAASKAQDASLKARKMGYYEVMKIKDQI